jgi:hypothetical protein
MHQLVVLFYYRRQMKNGIGPSADVSKSIPTYNSNKLTNEMQQFHKFIT